ncbi:hypothetical protein BBJ41_32745 [Burkholderia stabilis]|uniref:hypothetical protein n=1 Tax=Burkholderia stabilis TaxID=95485 RepID=UPI000851E434|nr:hypothetical protein [Burkholderia stabilis]AOR72414.1 hypothetical protein BBJ41_32745 [Burkholderia stabilis]HDR9489686.1 hypothetical protein [Burkholderia stabilis]HDR9536503.1 hypothetical protein [Burkholderia stabilis]HDR9552016.1 hypothetical protein [Burkholderia stabilis]HDR9562978.1 hypothetical protein [Burkholderia stabilis]
MGLKPSREEPSAGSVEHVRHEEIEATSPTSGPPEASRSRLESLPPELFGLVAGLTPLKDRRALREVSKTIRTRTIGFTTAVRVHDRGRLRDLGQIYPALRDLDVSAYPGMKNGDAVVKVRDSSRMTPTETADLVAMLHERRDLRSVQLHQNFLGKNPERAIPILNALASVDALKMTNLAENNLGSDARVTAAAIDFVKKAKNLESMNINDNFGEPDHENSTKMMDALRENKNITSLELRGNWLGWHPDGADALAKMLGKDGSLKLKSIDLGDNFSSSRAQNAVTLLHALRDNTTLESAGLAKNQLGRSELTANATFDMLRTNRTLESVDLKGNGLGMARDRNLVEPLAAALRENTNLKSIDLRDNGFSAEELEVLSKLAEETGKTILTNVS